MLHVVDVDDDNCCVQVMKEKGGTDDDPLEEDHARGEE